MNLNEGQEWWRHGACSAIIYARFYVYLGRRAVRARNDSKPISMLSRVGAAMMTCRGEEWDTKLGGAGFRVYLSSLFVPYGFTKRAALQKKGAMPS